MQNRKLTNRVSSTVGARIADPRRGGLLVVLLIGAVLFAMAVGARPALAADEPEYLYITGIIKNVNAGTGLVMVDVLSSSCRGMRMFRAEKTDKAEAYLDQKASFFIDTEKCRTNEVYTMLVERGIWK